MVNSNASPTDCVWYASGTIGMRYLHTDFPIQWAGMKLLESSDKFYFYENQRELLPVTFFHTAHVIEDPEARLQFMKSSDYVPSDEVILSDEKNSAEIKGPGGKSVDSFHFLEGNSTEHFGFQTKTVSNSIVMVRLAAYPGWQIKIDGQKKEWMTVNHAFIGFLLPAGNHEVQFDYNPTPWPWAWFISAMACVFLLLGVLLTQSLEKRCEAS